VNGVRSLDDANAFADRLQEITEACPGTFINVRTDTFLLNVEDALEETLYRGQLYAAHGANSFFVPGMTQPDSIAALVHHVPLPVNVMCMPTLPDFSTLASLGVRRISMGNFIHAAIQAKLKESLCKIQAHQSFADVFDYENN